MDDRDEPERTAGDATTWNVRRAVEGDGASLEWVVAHFAPLVETHVRLRLGAAARNEHDVRDLANEVWLVALRKLGRLRARGGRLVPVFASFLGTTATNLCNNHLRRRIRGGAGPAAAAGPSEGSAADPMDRFAAETMGVVTRAAREDVSAMIRRCLDRLTEDKRHVVVLRLLEDRSNSEIAEIVGVPANTVAARYRRALADLRACLPGSAFEGIAGLSEGASRPSAD